MPAKMEGRNCLVKRSWGGGESFVCGTLFKCLVSTALVVDYFQAIECVEECLPQE